MYISSKFATGVKTTNNENDLANGLLVLQCVLLTFFFSSQVSLLKESGASSQPLASHGPPQSGCEVAAAVADDASAALAEVLWLMRLMTAELILKHFDVAHASVYNLKLKIKGQNMVVSLKKSKYPAVLLNYL